MNDRLLPIYNADQVRDEVHRVHQVSHKLHLVKSVMNEEVGMRYRRIKRIQLQQNSDINIILRHQWALKYIELLKQGYRFINADESWASELQYQRMKWRAPGTTNSVPVKQVQPRISIIAALDMSGQILCSLSHSNTTSNTMSLYIKGLVRCLDKQDVKWRDRTILLIDGTRVSVLSSEVLINIICFSTTRARPPWQCSSR